MSGRRSRNLVRWTLLIIVVVVGRASAGSVATNPDPADGATVWPLIGGTNVYTTLEFSPGAGAVSHTGYFSDDYRYVSSRDPTHCLGAPPFPKLSPTLFLVGFDDAGLPAFVRAPLERGKTYYWAIDEFDGTTTHPGAVWSFTVMTEKTWNPDPADGVQDVIADPEVTLNWSRGDVETTGYEVSYEVYYGTDSDAVEVATIPNATVSALEYAIGDLVPGAEYFWRVDTVLTHSAPPFGRTTIEGDLWSFKAFRNVRTITVDDDGPADFANIQAAINHSEDDDTVVVMPGTYTGYGNRDIDFGGKAITVRGTDPNDPDVVKATIIDCDGSESHPHRAFKFHHGEGPDSRILGMAIRNGYGPADLISSHRRSVGGAIYCDGSNPTIANCNFTENTSGYHGAAICNRKNSSPTITDCVFGENLAVGNGGAIYNWDHSSPTVTNCIFRGNVSAGGGGIYSEYGCEPLIINCIFTHNSTNNYWGGGGVFTGWGSSAIYNCVFAGNSSGIRAGAICNYRSSTTIRNCIIWGNQAPDGAEIYLMYNGELSVEYSDVRGGLTNIYTEPGCTVDWGRGNIDVAPQFIEPAYRDTNGIGVEGDYHLLPGSPCINTGDPDFVAEYAKTDIDGEKRVMLGRVDMGADEFNPVVAEFVVVRRERVERSVFEYECEVVLENVSTFALENIRLQMTRWSKNMTTIEPNVTFGDTEIRPGESVRSLDTCTFTVDRSVPIDPAEIIWHSTAEMADTGATLEHTLSSLLSVGPADNSNFDDLTNLADQWLWLGPPGSIKEDTAQDGTVNLADFAKFAEQWSDK